MESKMVEGMLCELAWQYGTDEFHVGQNTYRFVRPLSGRKADHLMVKYPEGGLATCKERWRDFEGRYKVGGSFLLKSEILSQFALRQKGDHVLFQGGSKGILVDYKTGFEKVTTVLRDLQSSSCSEEILAPRSQIADMAGVSTATVSTALKTHSEAGNITCKGTLQGMVIRFLRGL